jgi:hypothetical protein
LTVICLSAHGRVASPERPSPAAKDPLNPGEFLARRAHWVTNNLKQDHALQ